MLGTIDHAGQVLALFTAERPEWGVSEVARALGLSKTRSHALLSSLAHVGLLHRMQTGRYRLGFRVLALSRVLLQHTPWREVAAAEMRVLAARIGGRVNLAAFDGLELVTLASGPKAQRGRRCHRPAPPRDGSCSPPARPGRFRPCWPHIPAAGNFPPPSPRRSPPR